MQGVLQRGGHRRLACGEDHDPERLAQAAQQAVERVLELGHVVVQVQQQDAELRTTLMQRQVLVDRR
ncbi:hypothetical protein D3C76_1713410 [compost metagenome]